MEDLRITIVQSKLYWENTDKNLEHFSLLLKQVKAGSTDLILLPEMFSTGFSMNAKQFAENKNGKAIKWMKQMAAEKRAVISGSIMTEENGKFYNRLIWMKPDGTYQHYDKRHLFRMGKEEQTYTRGSMKIYTEVKGWKILPLVCYDLRFPVWSRQQKEPYDLLIYVANWPARRRFAWQQLLTARAIENISYVAGLNRIGTDGNNILHTGNSAVLDFMGTRISKTKPRMQSVETITLSGKNLQNFRKEFPALMDADDFEIKK